MIDKKQAIKNKIKSIKDACAYIDKILVKI